MRAWWDGRLVVVAEEWWAATHAGGLCCQWAAVGLDVHTAEQDEECSEPTLQLCSPPSRALSMSCSAGLQLQ